LRVFINHRQEQWPDWLETTEFAYNNKIYSTTQVSPFKANYGQNPGMGFEGRWTGKYKAALRQSHEDKWLTLRIGVRKNLMEFFVVLSLLLIQIVVGLCAKFLHSHDLLEYSTVT